MDRHVAALVLEEIASLLELDEADPFRVRAYRTAARAVEAVQVPLPDAISAGTLPDVPGLGPATLGVVRELVETGRSRLYERLRARIPAGAVRLRAVPGLGPKRARALHEALGIETLDELRVAARGGRVAGLKGFGPATERRVLEGLDFVDRSAGRRRQPEAHAAARRLVGFLESLPVRAVRLAGELRRGRETVGSLDLLVVTDHPDDVLSALVALPGLTTPARVGALGFAAAFSDGMPVRVRCTDPAAAGVAWIHETGSGAHVRALAARAEARGLRLDADGLQRGDTVLEGGDEAAVYGALGLPWIPPELREGRGEVAAAEDGGLPRLVELDDLRGTFHCHTTWSDGTATVAELGEAARDRGWRYLGIADHSVSAGYAGGLSVDEVRRQQAEIDAWNAARGDEVRLFKGIEADILADGALDYDDAVLATFDYVVGSVHSRFRMPREAMTRRITRAVSNPALTILGHATGRLLLTREPYDVDLDAVIDAAARAGAAIEINADPHRLDLDWRHWPGAKAKGVACAIDPDAHSVAGLGAVAYGITMARKGWLEPEDVINTWTLERVESYLGER